MKKTAVIVAAGAGTRMGGTTLKQFITLNGRPVLFYPIHTFIQAYPDIDIILTLPEQHIETGEEIVDAWFEKDRISITPGGETRFHSVKNGLSLINEECIVFVHDAVRCILSTTLVRRCYEAAVKNGSAIPVMPSRDSVRLVDEEGNTALDRSKVMLVQTPQTFHSKILLPAYEIDYKDKYTDEATVVEAYGIKLHLVEGEENNMKITRPADLVMAEAILQANERN